MNKHEYVNVPLAGFAAFSMLSLEPGMADQPWRLEPLTDHVPPTIVAETRPSSPGGLPNGLVSSNPDGADIVAAWYDEPTARYRHGILGDAIEAGRLRVELTDATVLSLVLPDSQVFEDRYPRLADLNGDGKTEIITIRSSTTEGAAVTVYGVVDIHIEQRASTAFIGRANRWLNIAGIANYAHLSRKQIAYVKTPHIGGTLIILDYDGRELIALDQMHGFSNHLIGAVEMQLSANADVNGDGLMDLAIPSASRNALRIVGFDRSRLTEYASIPLPGLIDKAIASSGRGAKAHFVIGLTDGTVYKIFR